ncbi:MAG: hypothetical protein ACD_4C00283G0003 [uncultured bacterium (gcode 4)]|uniref:RiboL-PSP-HEPN domain-containing protein n=1 Tax=uncultured bacterium (gcode 4) TaxID=1234023 RepID=K2FX55_9BACT|nr:MAG: hypothetical protein ACD_4C00283G0003 [uncultured bacterium (gcode 4)]
MQHIIDTLFDNLYQRKQEIDNINILMNNEISNGKLSNKWKILLKSWIILINAHWEGYIRYLLKSLLSYIFTNLNAESYLFLSDNFYSRDIKTWNNIKYESLNKILGEIFWDKDKNIFYMNFIWYLNKSLHKHLLPRNWAKDDIENVINDLVNLRNHYGHWSIDKIWSKLKVIDDNYDLKGYNVLCTFIIKFMESLTNEFSLFIIKKKYIQKSHLYFVNNNIEYLNSQKEDLMIYLLTRVDRNNIIEFSNIDFENKSVIIKHMIKDKYVKYLDKAQESLEIDISKIKIYLSKYNQKYIFQKSVQIDYFHKSEFNLQDDLYLRQIKLNTLYNSKTFKSTINRLLQECRDDGVLIFLWNWKYKLK